MLATSHVVDLGLLLISVSVLIYLLYALIYPEKF